MASLRQGKVEASTLSRSTTISNKQNANTRLSLTTGRYSSIDCIFPIFDEMLKNVYIPKMVYNIFFLFLLIQISSSSFYPGFLFLQKYEETWGYAIRIINTMTFFTDLSASDESMFIRFMVVTLIIVIFAIMMVIQALLYRKNRRFIKWTLYPTRLLIEFGPSILTAPTGLLTGLAFYRLLSNTRPIYFVYFSFGIIYSIVIIIANYIQATFINSTAYISTAPVACWNGKFYFAITIIPLITSFFSLFLQMFDYWMLLILVGIKFISNIVLASQTFYLPFFHPLSNSIFGSVLSATCAGDVVFFLRILGISAGYMYVVIAYLVILAICLVAFHFINKRTVKTVSEKLMESALESLTSRVEETQASQSQESVQFMFLSDPNRRQLFQTYKLDKSLKRAEMFLRVGLMERCDLFLDWSLIKFVAEFHTSTRVMCMLTQFLTYFPSETRLLNYFFVQATSSDDLSYSERFLIYQVHKVKSIRQSSTSSETTDRLLELKRMSLSCIAASHDFWRNIPDDPSRLYEIRSQSERIKSLFEEALTKWPNNVRLCEDYSHFLIECATNFTYGLKIKHRAELIELGKNFVVDLSFRSLVRAYPLYLKRKIVDTKGNFISANIVNRIGASNSSNGISNCSSGTIDGELEVEVEERLAKTTFSYHRVRLAYQKSLVGKKSNYSAALKVSMIWTLFFGSGLLCFCYGYFYDIFSFRSENLDRQAMMTQFRFYYDSAMFSMLMHWIKTIVPPPGAKTISNATWERYGDISEAGDGEFHMDLSGDLRRTSNKWNIRGQNKMADFVDEMIRMAAQGTDVRSIMSVMINGEVNKVYCNGDQALPIEEDMVSFKTLLSYLLIVQRGMIFHNDVTNWHDSQDYCELMKNTDGLGGGFASLTLSMSQEQTNLMMSTHVLNMLFLIIIPIIFLFITIPSLIFFLNKVFSDLKLILRLCLNLDESFKIEASKPLKTNGETDQEQETISEQKKSSHLSTSVLYIIIMIPVLVVIALFIGVIFLAEQQNTSFLELNQWMMHGLARAPSIIESYYHTFYVATVDDILNTTAVAKDYSLQNYVSGSMDNLLLYNNILLRGGDGVKPCIGMNDRFDQINFQEVCDADNEASGMHDFYKCASLDRAITFYCQLGQDIVQNIDNQEFQPNDNLYHFLHLGNVHMLDVTFEAANILSSMADTQISLFRRELAGISFGGIAIEIVVFVIFWFMLNKLDIAYDGAIQLLRRLSPTAVVGNTPLLNYLLNRKAEKNSDKMTASKSVIYLSKDAVLCLNKNETIEVVNQAVSTLLGYTPEQLLGQPLSSFVSQDKSEQLFSHMNLMRNGQCAMTFDTTTEGIMDDETTVPCHATLLGICDGISSHAKSFVVILRDETQLQRQRTEAEEAKAQSEKLLYQILPRDIVLRLNQGEADISFVVPSASVIFIDIVKFSDYAATLTPSQIMENLSTIFARFDTICQKYPLITKIKLIGDVYMAAAGLFTPDEQAASHASQVVQFGLDVLVALEDINTQLDSNLQVRVGVNTDGPLIAGVLGTDKPVFDIIGDTINVSSRLQSTCIPGTVQISQGTYDAIAGLNFNIEQRGEIELKGKGKKMAYLVRPIQSGSFFVRNESLTLTEGYL